MFSCGVEAFPPTGSEFSVKNPLRFLYEWDVSKTVWRKSPNPTNYYKKKTWCFFLNIYIYTCIYLEPKWPTYSWRSTFPKQGPNSTNQSKGAPPFGYSRYIKVQNLRQLWEVHGANVFISGPSSKISSPRVPWWHSCNVRCGGRWPWYTWKEETSRIIEQVMQRSWRWRWGFFWRDVGGANVVKFEPGRIWNHPRCDFISIVGI